MIYICSIKNSRDDYLLLRSFAIAMWRETNGYEPDLIPSRSLQSFAVNMSDFY